MEPSAVSTRHPGHDRRPPTSPGTRRPPPTRDPAPDRRSRHARPRRLRSQLHQIDLQPPVTPPGPEHERLPPHSAELPRPHLGTHPSTTTYHCPSGPATRSPCPVFCTARDVERAESTGLAGSPSKGLSGAGPQTMLIACPRSVPPSAINQVPPLPHPVQVRRLGKLRPRAGPHGPRHLQGPVRGQVDTGLQDRRTPRRAAGTGRAQPGVGEVDRTVVPGEVGIAIPVSGSFPVPSVNTAPSLHGPAGSVAVKWSMPRPPITVSTTWKPSSRKRSGGAQAPRRLRRPGRPTARHG